jgi:hypothetical protein
MRWSVEVVLFFAGLAERDAGGLAQENLIPLV